MDNELTAEQQIRLDIAHDFIRNGNYGVDQIVTATLTVSAAVVTGLANSSVADEVLELRRSPDGSTSVVR